MPFSLHLSDITEFTRVYLAVFYTSVAAFYTLRIILMKQTNSKEFVFAGKRFGKTWCNHATFRFFRAAIWLVCLSRLFYPALDNYIGIMDGFNSVPVILLGLFLLTVGFSSTIIIHLRLGEHWRSGIDPSGPTKLITDGIFQYSRNPMFVFVAMSQFGFFLALPSYFSLTCLVIGLYTLHSQTLEEEKHLKQIFPETYDNYAAKVRRWV